MISDAAIIDDFIERFMLPLFISFIFSILLLAFYCSQRESPAKTKKKPKYPDFEMDPRTL